MPYPNFHAARVKNPDAFARIVVLQTLPNGIMIYGGPLKSNPSGGTTAQAYRFPKARFTVAQARKWLKDHNIKPILFEPAGTSSQDTVRYVEEDGKTYRITKIDDAQTEVEELSEEEIEEFAKLATIKDMMVFKAGTHNGHKYTNEDIDQIAENFNALKKVIRPKLKITHKEDQEKVAGLASYGDIVSVAVKTIKKVKHLFVRVTNVPAEVKEWINDRRFPERSVEIWPLIKVNGKKFLNVLRNVSMLGHEPPAVPGMTPIRAVGDDFDFDNVTLAFEGDEESITVVFEEAQLKGGDLQMPENKVDVTEEVSKMQAAIEKLTADLAAKETEIVAMKGEKDSERLQDEKKDLVEKLADANKQVAKLQDLEKEAKEGKAAKDELKQMKDDTRKALIENSIKILKDEKHILPKEESVVRALMESFGAEAIKMTVSDGDGKSEEKEFSQIELLNTVLASRKHDAFTEVSERRVGDEITPTSAAKMNDAGELKTMKFEAGDRSGTTVDVIDENDIDKKAKAFMAEHKDSSYEDALIAVS